MIARASAGAVPGFLLAGLLLALLLRCLPGHGQAWLLPVLWLFFPLWWTIASAAFLCRSGLRAWLALGAADLLAFAALALARHAGG